jgi:predicted ATPase
VGGPSGTVTFLFTDIEGSTARWEADPEIMRAELGAHDQVLRSAITARGGFVFKHTGDGFCAAFSSPRSAVDAAIDAQRALALPVRMGITTGEVEQRGDDYFGPALNRAARVMACGHGGQIVVAAATAGLVSGVELADMGAHELRGLTEPVRLFQVRADGLRAEFAPLLTADSAPGNLRAQATTFIGRDLELAELDEALRANRLVTLTGVGGIGKTRLALQLAAQVASDFPEGVWVIELGPVGDPAAVPDAVATVLGITPRAGMTVAESVAAALDGRQRLLVLDNCEHVLDAAADLVDTILDCATTVKVVATSREGLRVTHEHLWPVPSLSVRDGAASQGVLLFLERARAVVPTFTADGAEDAGAVVEICRRLDGIPLAIELAASRMVSMSPAEVRDRLDDRFRLLSGSRRGLERHQTLRHAVQWSYDLLGADERTLLNRCSVFAGGFDLTAAVAVGGAGALDEYTVLEVLDALVRKSLLATERSAGRTRYAMLETIRQFAEDQLGLTGDGPAVRALHARYYAGRQADVLTVWNGPRQRDAYDWLDLELGNLRSAFRLAADQGDVDTAATIAVFSALLGFWAYRYEPLAWAEELIEVACACDHPQLRALYAIAVMCFTTGRLEDSVRYSEAAQALLDDPRYEPLPFGLGRHWVGAAYVPSGQPERWAALCRQDLDSGHDPIGLASNDLVLTLGLAGHLDEARALAPAAVEGAEATANPFSLTMALLAYGFAFRASDPPAALDAFRRGLAIAGESGNRNSEVHLAFNLGWLEASSGHWAASLGPLAQALRGYHDGGDFASLKAPLGVLVTVFDHIGMFEPAAVISRFAVSPMITANLPELFTSIEHLRECLGGEVYESLARRGDAMAPSPMVRYALEQADRAAAIV